MRGATRPRGDPRRAVAGAAGDAVEGVVSTASARGIAGRRVVSRRARPWGRSHGMGMARTDVAVGIYGFFVGEDAGGNHELPDGEVEIVRGMIIQRGVDIDQMRHW
jgi:hypothetical protein